MFLGSALAGLGSIAALNVIVNPMGYYAYQVIPRLVVNDTKDKQALFARALPTPEVVILGSSRSMKLRPETIRELTGLPTFNAATSSGTAEDVERMLRFVLRQGKVTPKLIILGVDLEMTRSGETVLTDRRIGWFRSVQSLSVEQTMLSLSSLRLWSRSGPPKILRRLDGDGYLHNLIFEEQTSSGRFDLDQSIDASMREYETYWKNFHSISKERLELLEDLLRVAHEHNVHVITFATPLHPRMRRFLTERGYEARKLEFERQWKAICSKWGAEFLDLSDPASFDGSDSGFYDGIHVNEDNASSLARRILKGGPHAVQ